MIGGYALNAHPLHSFACLKKMQDADNFSPDVITLINVLPSCAQLQALLEGRSIHGYAIRKGLLPHSILETSLIDMYGECGALNLSERVFELINGKNLVCWNAMLAAYVQNGWNSEALCLFRVIWYQPFTPDAFAFSSILPTCSELASLREGKQIIASSLNQSLV